MRRLILAIFVFTSASLYAEENSETDAIIDAMVIAKTTGMCGVFGQMSRFQESTKMPGGDEFVLRFLRTEAARLGQDLSSFLATCSRMPEQYNGIMNALGFKQ